MKIKKIISYILLSGVILFSCVEEFTPDVSDFDSYLVIEGSITNAKEAHVIKLSRTQKVGSESTYTKAESGAIITLNDDLGNVIVYTDGGNGVYGIQPHEFIGEIGREYYIRIETQDGEAYESEPMLMHPTPVIDSVYKEYAIHEAFGTDSEPIEGFQLYLDASDPSNSSRYFRFDYDETWEVFIKWKVPPAEQRHCWVSKSNENILLKDLEEVTGNRLIQFPISFIGNNTDRLRIKYSVNIKTLSLSPREFEYWEQLEKQTQSIGTLYDPIPMGIESNITCCTTPGRKVVGFFSVNAVFNHRYFISSSEHKIDIYDRYDYCPEIPPPMAEYFVLEWQPRLVTTDVKCTDCRFRGVTSKPGFWDDDNN